TIHHRDELAMVRQLRVLLRMEATQIADPDHRRPDCAHALLCPRSSAVRRRSSGAQAKLFNSLVRARDRYFALPPLQFEAVTFGLALLVGLIIMPMLIYFAGSVMLLA